MGDLEGSASTVEPKSIKKKKKVDGEETTKKKKTAKKKQSMNSSAASTGSSDTPIKPKSVKKKKKKKAQEDEDQTNPIPVPVKPPSISKTKSVAVIKQANSNDTADSTESLNKPNSMRTSLSGRSNHGRARGRGRGAPSQRFNNGGNGDGNDGPRRPQSMTGMNGNGNSGTNRPQSMRSSMSEHGAPQSMRVGGRGRGPNRAMSMANMGGRGRGRGRGPRRQASLRNSQSGGGIPFESPYLSDDGLSNGDPPPTSRRESAQPSLRAPNKPQSILRNSSHNGGRGGGLRNSSHHGGRGGGLRNSSHHGGRGGGLRNSSHHGGRFGGPSHQNSRANFHSSSNLSFDSSDDIEESLEGGPRIMLDRTPSMVGSTHSRGTRPSLLDSRSRSAGGSIRDLWSSFKRPTLSKFTSARSVLTFDMEFEDEPSWKQFLRYIRILPPHRDEKPIKKRIRIFTWVAMFLDFLAALVSITTYDGVSMCCGVPVLSIAGNINWTLAVRITTYIYMLLIFAEIVPVLRGGFPFNLLNPFIGFLITFAVFFDDRILEAVIMWLIEASAVLCEFFVYRLRLKVHAQREERLEETETELKEIKQAKRKMVNQYKSKRGGWGDSSDDSFDGESSFHDETTDSEDPMPTDVSQVRETRLLRERRLLRQTQSEDCRHLRYHFIGVAVNAGLAGMALLLICCIGRSGGLCVRDMVAPNVFKNDQLERCYDCQGTTGVCEICREDGTSHCYYPYF